MRSHSSALEKFWGKRHERKNEDPVENKIGEFKYTEEDWK